MASPQLGIARKRPRGVHSGGLQEGRRGVESLSELFVETEDVTYVYNQGRCFEQSHRREDALDRFLEYQRKNRTPSADEKLEIEQHYRRVQDPLGRTSTIRDRPGDTVGADSNCDLWAARLANRIAVVVDAQAIGESQIQLRIVRATGTERRRRPGFRRTTRT